MTKNPPPSVRSGLLNTSENSDQHRPRRSGWTPERRAAAAERIRKTRPWLRSTGPKTATGKARSSQNALKHGYYSLPARTKRASNRAIMWFNRHMIALYRLMDKILAKDPATHYKPRLEGLWEAFDMLQAHMSSRYHSPR